MQTVGILVQNLLGKERRDYIFGHELMTDIILGYGMISFQFEQQKEKIRAERANQLAGDGRQTQASLASHQKQQEYEINAKLGMFTDQYIAFMKLISLNLNKETKAFFFNPEKQFIRCCPLYLQAI
jgi:hypothetical protein